MTAHEYIWKTMPGIHWNPLVLLALFIIIALLIAFAGKLFFRADYHKGTDQVKPFNSGNLDEIDYNVKSSNLYWGFRKALDFYYRGVDSLHNGDLNDYMKWLAFTVSICLLLIGGGLL